MEYVELGTGGMTVSRICLGCMGLGDPSGGPHSWTLDETESREIIAYALEKGINFFDTAMAYQGGTGEEYLGRALRDCANRQDVVIATKFSPRTERETAAGKGVQHVTDMLDASLKRLGTDYVDLYICHMWDYHTPIEELLEGLNTAVKAGKVREIGMSNCYAWQLAKADAIAQKHGWPRFVSLQGHYNLLFREEEREMIPYCREEHIALTPYSPLAAGRLARHPGERSKRFDADTIARGKYDGVKDQDAPIIERVEELAERKNAAMAHIALAWLLEKTSAPIVGATKKSHIDDAVSALDIRLSTEETAWLEEPYQPHKPVGVMAMNKQPQSNTQG